MSYMNDELFFDTNILVYAYDASETKKQRACAQLVGKVFEGEIIGVVSNQVLGELFKGLTESIEIPISLENAELIIKDIIQSDRWMKINYDAETVKKAIVTVKFSKAPFWDILIVETMKENGINKIYTENEKDFKNIPGIKVINPFK